MRRVLRGLLLGLVGAAPGSVGATELDAWRPGSASGQLADPLAAHSPWALQPGSRGGGLWMHALKGPLYGVNQVALLDEDGAVGETQVSEMVEALSWFGPVGLMGAWRPLSSPLPVDLGGRARFRYLAYNPGLVEALDASAGLTDAAAWLRWTPAPLGRSHLAVVLEGNLDPDTLGDRPAAGDIAWFTGAGTGVSGTVSLGSSPAERGLHRWTALSVGVDLRRRDALAVAGELSPTQAGELQGGLSWVTPRWAALAELHGRGGRLAPAADGTQLGGAYESSAQLAGSLEGRLGLRWKMGESLRASAVIGAGLPARTATGDRIQPTGAPLPRLGLDLQWLGKPAPPPPEAPAEPARVGELAVAPVDAAGNRLRPLRLPGVQSRLGPDGERIVAYGEDAPITVEVEGHASVTLVPPSPGSGPWTWAPVLPPLGGEARVSFELVDPTGEGVEASSVVVEGAELGGSPPSTSVTVAGVAPGAVQLGVEGPLVLATDTEVVTRSSDESSEVVVLRPVGAVRVRVVTAGSPVVGAQLTARDGLQERSAVTDLDGIGRMVLGVGRWQLRVDQPGYGAQEQTLIVLPDQAGLQKVPFSLLESATGGSEVLDLEVLDRDGQRVSEAEVLLGDQVLGQTASGGRLRIEGLLPSEAPVTVRGSLLRTSEARPVDWQGEDDTRVTIPVGWQPGVLHLRVRGRDQAPVAGVTARFQPAGGESMPPLELGPDGELTTQVEPGAYEVVLSAPGHGLQVFDLEIPPEEDRRVIFNVVLRPLESSGTRLVVRVVAPEDGPPLDTATLRLDGDLLGTGPTDGRWVLTELAEGPHQLAVEAELYRPWAGRVELVSEDSVVQKVSLEQAPGLVELKAAHDGGPVAALVRMYGRLPQSPMWLGSDGRGSAYLPPGMWEAAFSAAGYALEVLDAEVESGRQLRLDWDPTALPGGFHMLSPDLRPVHVRLVDSRSGVEVAGRVRVLGGAVVRPAEARPGEPATFQLDPGNWELIAEVPERGVVGREVVVYPNEDDLTVDVLVGDSLVDVTDGELRITEQVLFTTGEAQIEAASADLLDAIARTLQVRTELWRVVIEGHTDDVGDTDRNLRLSEARAMAVRDALIARGVDPGRLLVEAYGESQPIADNASPEGRELNRRVVFRILERPVEAPSEP